MNNLKVVLTQMEVTPANPMANGLVMIEYITKAKASGADMIVFPEMCISGYLIGDTWERSDFLQECEAVGRSIIKASKDIIVIFGNVAVDWGEINEDGRPRKYNAMFVAYNGELCRLRGYEDKYGYGFVGKTLMPNYREFDDSRHFYSVSKHYGGAERNIDIVEVPFKGKTLKIGGMLCEDGWDNDYEDKPCAILYENGEPDLFVNISCSPYTFGKNGKRNRVFSRQAMKYETPMVYVNNVGIQNNNKTLYTFDGESCVYDHNGDVCAPFMPYETGGKIVEVPLQDPVSDFSKYIAFNDLFKEDISSLFEAVQYGCRKFMDQIGVKKIVIGASGGIDSALSAAIFSTIVDPDDLYLINMPSKYNSETTQDLAFDLAKNLCCHYGVFAIQNDVDSLLSSLEDNAFHPSDFAMENIQARDRLRILAAVAASVGGVFVCNGNKSETTVGYATLYGDIGGFLAPLADLWKTQVYEMAEYINDCYGNIIPQGIIDLVPSAELSAEQDVDAGKGDPLIYPYHDKLFASWAERWNRATPFDILVWYRDEMLEEQIGYKGCVKDLFGSDEAFINDLERWWNLYNGLAVAKRSQAPIILGVSCRAFGFDHRESQTKPYYGTAYEDLKNEILKGENNEQ